MSTSANINQVLSRIRDIPSLPTAVSHILMCLSKPNTSADKISRYIQLDPGLTSRVLKLVNSASFGFQRQIAQIPQAIAILGFNVIRGLVISASMLKTFRVSTANTGLNHEKFWEHCFYSALASKVVAEYLRLEDSDEAFSVGMLHDIGKIVFDTYFKSDYNQVIEVARANSIASYGDTFYLIEKQLLEMTHAEVGAIVAKQWHLPDIMVETIRWHHEPRNATSFQLFVYAMALANVLTHCLDDPQQQLLLDQNQGDFSVLAAPLVEEYQAWLDVLQINADDITRLLARISVEWRDNQDLIKEMLSAA